MKLIFTGDIVFPNNEHGLIDNVNEIFKGKICIGNLEGPIIETREHDVVDYYKYNLYSQVSSVNTIMKLNFKYLSLANNHISDFINGVQSTTEVLRKNNIEYFGLKNKPYCIINDGEKEIYILGTSTYITGGNYLKNNPISRLKPFKLINDIKKIREKNKNALIIVFIHWGYELAYYPQPADRKWARDAINSGANMIIGHHPHVLQGIEEYNGGLIAYSLGNFHLPQTEYMNRTLTYKTERVLDEIVLEYDTIQKTFIFHWFKYNKESHHVSFIESLKINSDKTNELTPYNNFSNTEYKKWFLNKKKQMIIENSTTRYPTYTNYTCFFGFQFYLYNNYFKFYQLLRKLLIKLKIHKPYNW